MQEFEYQLLGRLQSDCEYFIKTSPSEKHLWAGDVKGQIAKMLAIWADLNVKPEWLTLEQIKQYEQQMTEILENKEIAGI